VSVFTVSVVPLMAVMEPTNRNGAWAWRREAAKKPAIESSTDLAAKETRILIVLVISRLPPAMYASLFFLKLISICVDERVRQKVEGMP
jgi:hypothetical protein